MHDDGSRSAGPRSTGTDPAAASPGTLPPLRSTLLPSSPDLPTSARSSSHLHPIPHRPPAPSSSWRSVTEAGFSPSGAGPRPAGFLGTRQRWASPWAPGAAAGPLPGVRRRGGGPSLATTVVVSVLVAAVVGGLVGGAVSGFGSHRVVRRIVERPSPTLSGAPADLSGLVRGVLPSVVGVVGPSGRSASGVAVGASTVLTTATLVQGASTVRVAVPGGDGLVRAKVAAVARSMNVALVRLPRTLRLRPVALHDGARPAEGASVVVVGRVATGAGTEVVSVVEGRVVDPSSAYLLHTSRGTVPLVGLVETDAPVSRSDLGVLVVGGGGGWLGTVSMVGPASNLPGAPAEAFVTPVGLLRRAVQSAEAGAPGAALVPPLS